VGLAINQLDNGKKLVAIFVHTLGETQRTGVALQTMVPVQDVGMDYNIKRPMLSIAQKPASQWITPLSIDLKLE
jgi:hypothetical protein